MPSGSSSRSGSTKTALILALALAALSIAATSAPARTNSEWILARNQAGPVSTGLAWSPLADLYAARSWSVAEQAADSGAAEPVVPQAAPAAPQAAPAEPQKPPEPAGTSAPAEPARRVNPRKALMLSLLLPGLGELYSGHKGRATGFFISEGAIWANFAAWEIAGHLRKDNYIEQARLNAGVGTDSESDDYWRLVGIYARSSGSGPDSYEDELRRDARNEFPGDPAAQDAWVAERLPTGNRAWNWTSASLQDDYRRTRQNSSRAFSRAKFSFALAILNRLASAIDTQILHRADTKAGHSRIDRPFRVLTLMTADGGGKVLVRHTF